MRSESFRKGVKDGIPIGLGYFAVSFTFGMMAVADGLSIWQAYHTIIQVFPEHLC